MGHRTYPAMTKDDIFYEHAIFNLVTMPKAFDLDRHRFFILDGNGVTNVPRKELWAFLRYLVDF